MEALTALLKDRRLGNNLVVMATEGMRKLLKAPRCYYDRMTYIKKLQSDLILLGKQEPKKYLENALIGHQTPNSGADGIASTSFATRYKDVTESSARTVRMLKILDAEFRELG